MACYVQRKLQICNRTYVFYLHSADTKISEIKKRKTVMNKKFLYGILIVIAGIGLLVGLTQAKPIHESALMLCFGLGLVGIAGVIKQEKD